MYPAPAYRYRRTAPGGFKRLAARAVFFSLLLLLLKSSLPFYPLVKETARGVIFQITSRDQAYYLEIITEAMPILRWAGFEGDMEELSPGAAALELIGAVGRVNLHSPAAVLRSQIPLLAAVAAPAPQHLDLPAFGPPLPGPVSSLPGEVMVCIYNTHTGETYSLTDGVERLDGKHGGVVTVAAALQEALEGKHGIKVARSDRINDENYSASYLESEKTARELLAANPGARLLLDIHRDSEKVREQSVVKINGQEAAPILLIVGSDARRPFPNWRQNYDLALKVHGKAEQMYPGLSLGVRVKDGVYNQNLHPGAMLIEMGTTMNSTEEAVLSARLLADVLAALLTEE